ncbi:hypothetical protein TorRG33x02_062580 [Trema orientale]|uniref:Uncharacterized protein n=1 Tax=Trema orientale TaxID=63057 RepID=A0A2P5FJJ1_TREOI|nr:hypothetical protein TorRG33x02_062580 [Trema orientale]
MGFTLVNDQRIPKVQAAPVAQEAPVNQDNHDPQPATHSAQPNAPETFPPPSSPHKHSHFNFQEVFDSLNNRINTLQLDLQQLQLDDVECFKTLQAQVQSSQDFQAQKFQAIQAELQALLTLQASQARQEDLMRMLHSYFRFPPP